MSERTPDTPGRSLGGRFDEATDPLLERINRSIDVDRRLWPHDIRGSRAHARMLARVGLIEQADLDAILGGLDSVEAELREGRFSSEDADEDIHMAVERRLTELIGDPARRLHTGRSRNDQVMTDTLLWLKEALSELARALSELTVALLDRAEDGVLAPMPAFTHNQPAQVSSVACWLLAHAAAMERNIRRATDLDGRIDECPLGSGAAAGGYLPIDRDATAAELGFARPSTNAINATGSRSDLLDAVALLGIVGSDLSRLGEELVLYASPQFAWVRFPDRLTTGSSLLPHKRNPDGAELLRGGGQVLAAEFTALAAAASGIVSGYSKDLQYDKEVLFRAHDRAMDLLALAKLHIEGMTLDEERMADACTPALAALWLADRLVELGTAFRDAHKMVGAAAKRAEDEGIEIAEALARDVPAELRPELEGVTPEVLLERLVTSGGAGPESTRAQIATLRQSVTSS